LADHRVLVDELLLEPGTLRFRLRALHRLLGRKERRVALHQAFGLLELRPEERHLRQPARALVGELDLQLLDARAQRALAFVELAKRGRMLRALFRDRRARLAQRLLRIAVPVAVRPETLGL